MENDFSLEKLINNYCKPNSKQSFTTLNLNKEYKIISF